jgi:phage protein D
LDEVRADWHAKAVIRKKSRELFSIDGTTIGLPTLRPGNHVEIRGMRPPFDGFYYVTKTTHSFGADGLRTRFTAQRPGMELPNAQGRFVESGS